MAGSMHENLAVIPRLHRDGVEFAIVRELRPDELALGLTHFRCRSHFYPPLVSGTPGSSRSDVRAPRGAGYVRRVVLPHGLHSDDL